MRSSDPHRDRIRAGLIFSATALGFIAWALLLPMWRAHRSLEWSPSTCTVVSTGYAEHRDSHGNPITVLLVEYTYDVRGVVYHGGDVDFAVRDSASSEDVAVTARRGDQLPCWYDPAVPEQAVLVRTGWSPGVSMWFAFGFLVVMAGLGTALVRPERGDLVGLAAIAPRAILTAMVVACSYFAWDGGTSAGTASALTVIASAFVVWVSATVHRWRTLARAGLPIARARSA
jgi:hypothetical protein